MRLRHFYTFVLSQWQNPGRRQLLVMLVATVMGSALTLLVQLSLSWILPPSDFGEIRLVYGYFLLCTPFVLLGVVAPLQRLVVSPKRRHRQKLYWRMTLYYWLPVAVIISVCTSLLAYSGLLTHAPELAVPLALLMLALPAWGLTELYQNFWKFTRERMRASAGLLVAKLGMVGALVLVVADFLNPVLAFPIGFLGGIMCAAVIMWGMHKGCWSVLPKGTNVIEKRLNRDEWQVVKTFMPMALLANAINIMSVQMDVIFLDRFSVDAHIVGLYMFAIMFANTVLLIQDPILSYLVPELGHTYEVEPRAFLRKVFLYQACLSFAMFALAFIMVFLVPLLVFYSFDASYQNAMKYLPWVAVTAVVQGSAGVFYIGLFMRNQLHVSTLITVAMLIVSATCVYILMPDYGVWGLIYGKLVGGIGFIIAAIGALLWLKPEATAK